MKTKIKIMETRPGVTDEEIRSQMNFEGLLKQRQEVIALQHRVTIKWIVAGTITVVVLAVSTWFFLNDNTTLPVATEQIVTTPAVGADKAKPADDRAVPEEKAVVKETPARLESTKENAASVEIQPQENTNALTDKSKVTVEVVDPVYVQAEPREGYSKLYDYFGKELNYPESAVKDSVQGVVTIMFTINPSGTAENITIRNSLGKAFDDEAIRLIQHMPSWNAATLNGKPVASKISLPLTFQIRRIKPNE